MTTGEPSVNTEHKNRQLSIEQLDLLLKSLLALPKYWLWVIGILVLLSAFDITWNTPKGLSVIFHTTNTTAIFLALIWLPALVKVFLTIGGTVKTPAGEMTSPGLSPDLLGFLYQQVDQIQATAGPEYLPTLQEYSHELQQAILAHNPLPLERQQKVQALVKQYNHTRASMPPGRDRTALMGAVAGQMRALVSQVNFLPEEIDRFLQSKDGGERLLGLSILESKPDVQYFDQILQVISHSASAFEQWHALRAMQSIASRLDEQQKARLREVLTTNEWIQKAHDRYELSQNLLAAIGQ